jgi:hypothetical protein
MTADLVAFLRARLNEDEQEARACPGDGTWSPSAFEVYGPDLSDEVRTHAARQDPGRTLREVEAKRRILAEHRQSMPGWCVTCDVPGDLQGRTHGCTTVRLLSAVYADHPEYRQEWAP